MAAAARRGGSFSVNDPANRPELLTPDEVRMLDNRKGDFVCPGERPMLDDKYDLMRHEHPADRGRRRRA